MHNCQTLVPAVRLGNKGGTPVKRRNIMNQILERIWLRIYAGFYDPAVMELNTLWAIGIAVLYLWLAGAFNR